MGDVKLPASLKPLLQQVDATYAEWRDASEDFFEDADCADVSEAVAPLLEEFVQGAVAAGMFSDHLGRILRSRFAGLVGASSFEEVVPLPDLRPEDRPAWREKLESQMAQARVMADRPGAKLAQYRRTCGDCGTTWFVPSELANEKLPPKSQVTGAKMMSLGTGALAGVGRLGHAQVQSLEAQRQRVLEMARCPSCGSTRFRQSKG